MQYVNQVIDDLQKYSNQWMNDEITKQQLDQYLIELIARLNLIEINMSRSPLDNLEPRVVDTYRQLEARTRLKATHSLQLLQNTDDKNSYTRKLDWMIGCRLYYSQLNKKLDKNKASYIHRNQLKFWNDNRLNFTKKEIDRNGII